MRYGFLTLVYIDTKAWFVLKILTRKIPFYHYKSENEVVRALVNEEIPTRAMDRLEVHSQSDDHVWNLMKRCWDYNPQNRPAFREIQGLIAQTDIADNRLPTSLQPENAFAFWEAMRGDQVLDYEVVSDILLHVSCGFGSFVPHVETDGFALSMWISFDYRNSLSRLKFACLSYDVQHFFTCSQT